MKTYLVTLIVTTPTLSLEEVTHLIGVEPDSSSHSVGAPRIIKRKGNWEETSWKFESDRSETALLDEHLEFIAETLESLDLANKQLPADVEVSVDIAVMYDTVSVSALLAPRWIKVFSEYGVFVEITCYPCNFSSENENDVS